jgi:hypothetical protein
MEVNILDVSALSNAYRDSITLLSNSAVHRKNVDDSMVGKECYICMRSWQIGEEVVTLHFDVNVRPGHTRPAWPSAFSRRAAALRAESLLSRLMMKLFSQRRQRTEIQKR